MFALLVRLSLLTPQHKLFGKVLIDAETYNRVFTLHGAIMVFLFIIPSVPGVAGEFRLAPDAGRERRGVPTAESGQFLPVVHRRGTGGHFHDLRRGRYRLDLLHALLAPPRRTASV